MPNTEPDATQVAVGVAVNSESCLLVGQRPGGKDFAGQWEFPGGKLEPGENAFNALVREFREETNLVVDSAKPLFTTRYDYADASVLLHFWHITAFSGDLKGLESQALEWVSEEDLSKINFLEGNRALLKRICSLVIGRA
ncbi:NUDIX domain-containing protein [Arenicellales bacterium nBUS_45]